MKALMKVAAGPGHIELRDIAEPSPEPGQLVLAVTYAGICGTDLHIVADEFPNWPPVVLGHEFTGQVQAVGPGVDPGLSALERAPVTPGDTVMVTGPGPVGMLAALAAELGFAAVTDPAEAQSLVASASAGRGADLLVETTGSPEAIRLGIDLLRRRAKVAAIGLNGRPGIEFDWDRAMYKALDIAMSSSSAYTAWEPALFILSQCAQAADRLVTEFALDQWEDAVAAVRQRSVIKAAFALAAGEDET